VARTHGVDEVARIRWCAVAGLAACVAYPLAVFAPLPKLVVVVLAAFLGPLLAAGSWGLRMFVHLDRRRFAADLAAISNALAGALLTAMLLVQLAAKLRGAGGAPPEVVPVWLGLDVAWDVYVGLGTLMFGIAFFRHPRLGSLVGGSGIVLAVGLLAFNLYTFPEPPADAGLIDLGPFVGLWYMVATLVVLASLRWARAVVEERGEADPGAGPWELGK
jgi:hypothetical protein